jgi:hypothetical protein
MITNLLAVFAGGVLGSAHCVGMCGGFAAAIGATHRPFWPTFGRQIVYSVGRICTYGFLGAVGGSAGLYLSRFRTPLVSAQQVFSILAGVIMLYVGLSVLGVIRLPRRGASTGQGFLPSLFTHFLNAKGPWSVFTAGLATGFLPCGLVYSFLAMAVATGNLVHGGLLMICFGLGTTPAMVLIGCGSGLLSHAARARIFRVAAGIVVVLGVVTIARAFPAQEGDCCHPGTAVHD